MIVLEFVLVMIVAFYVLAVVVGASTFVALLAAVFALIVTAWLRRRRVAE